MTHVTRQADYWTRVSSRTGRSEHIRAAEFWRRVANLRPPIEVLGIKVAPILDWARALFLAKEIELITRWAVKGKTK